MRSVSTLEASNNIRAFLMAHDDRVAQAAKSLNSSFADVEDDEQQVATITATSMGPGESLPGDRIAQLRAYIEAIKEEEKVMAAKASAMTE